MPAPSTASTAMRAGNAIWPPFLSGPSDRRLQGRRGLTQTTRRKGKRAAYQEQPWYWELSYTTPRHGDRPWEIVHLDHTQLDIELVSSLGTPLGRPYATFATDAYSRRLLACYLSFDPPSYRSCMMVLRACVRRHARFPANGGSRWRPGIQEHVFREPAVPLLLYQEDPTECRAARRKCHRAAVRDHQHRICPQSAWQYPGVKAAAPADQSGRSQTSSCLAAPGAL